MTSQIRVDEITNRSGLGTVTIYDNGFEFTGVTTFTEDVDITGGLTIGGVLTYEDVTNIDSVGVVTARAGLHVTGGNLGVGLNNPDRALSVSDQSNGNLARFIGPTNNLFIMNDRSGVIDLNSSGTGDHLCLGTQNTERLRITSGGSVGIGTDNPGGGSLLHVHGGAASTKNHLRLSADRGLIARLGDTSSAAQSLFDLYDTDGSTQIVRFISGGSNNFVNTGGNLGIGTDNPISNLQVFGTNGIRITNSANQSATTLLNFESNHPAFRMLNTSGDTTVKFKSDGDSFITSGNLGIGTDNPASTLDVAGTGQFKNNGATVKIESVPGNNFTQVQFKNDGGSFYVGRENNAGNWFATGAEYASVLRSDGSYPVIFRVNGANRFRINPNGDIGIANTSPSNWGSGVPTVEIKGNASSQPTRGGFLGFESYSGTDGYGGMWLNNDQLSFWLGESRYAAGSYVTPQERLRIAYADYPYIGISTNGTFRDQRLPLSIHGRGFGHGQTQMGTTQDAVYLTAGASGTYSTLTLTVNKNSWGSVAYEIHAAAYSGRHLHRIGGFYQNGNSISGHHGTTTASSSSTFAISSPASQQFTMTISGGNWIHPSAWVRLVLSGNGFLRSDLITFSWS